MPSSSLTISDQEATVLFEEHAEIRRSAYEKSKVNIFSVVKNELVPCVSLCIVSLSSSDVRELKDFLATGFFVQFLETCVRRWWCALSLQSVLSFLCPRSLFGKGVLWEKKTCFKKKHVDKDSKTKEPSGVRQLFICTGCIHACTPSVGQIDCTIITGSFPLSRQIITLVSAHQGLGPTAFPSPTFQEGCRLWIRWDIWWEKHTANFWLVQRLP